MSDNGSPIEFYHKNPRQITVQQFENLERWLEELGDLSGVVHDLNSNQIIGGNQRGRVFEINECEIVLTDEYDEPDDQGTVAIGYIVWKGYRYTYRQVRWTPEQCEMANIVANRAGGEWDFDILANEFELDDLLNWGFIEHDLDLDLWLPEPPEDPGAQIDKAEELRDKWGVEPGQLWRLGEHRLICGDCTDAEVVARVMDGEKADMLLTDPPYAIDLDTDYSTIKGSKKSLARNKGKGEILGKKYKKVESDDIPFDASNLIKAFDYVVEQIWFGANYYRRTLSANDLDGSWLVWDKRPSANIKGGEGIDDVIGAGFELIWSRNKHQQRMLRYQWSGFTARNPEYERAHPTEKPLVLIGEILERWSKSGWIITDPFLGSGTTLIACERLGRKCRAVEISPAYCAVAIQRWVDMTGGEPELVELNLINRDFSRL